MRTVSATFALIAALLLLDTATARIRGTENVDLTTAAWFLSAPNISQTPATLPGLLSATLVIVWACRCFLCCPGDIYSDLQRAKVIGDPLFRFGDADYAWVGRSDFTYFATFSVDSPLLACRQVLLVRGSQFASKHRND